MVSFALSRLSFVCIVIKFLFWWKKISTKNFFLLPSFVWRFALSLSLVCVCVSVMTLNKWHVFLYVVKKIAKSPLQQQHRKKKRRTTKTKRFDADYWYPLSFINIFALSLQMRFFTYREKKTTENWSSNVNISWPQNLCRCLVKQSSKIDISSVKYTRIEWTSERGRERENEIWKYVLINLCKTVDTSAVLKIITLDDDFSWRNCNVLAH